MPILREEQVRQLADDMRYSEEANCLILSLCALVLIQPGFELRAGHIFSELQSFTTPSLRDALLDEIRKGRRDYDYVENPTVLSVITSFFLFRCCIGLDRHNSAWFHLREATASVQILEMHHESHYLKGNALDNSIKRWLFWLLFITERQAILSSCRVFDVNIFPLGIFRVHGMLIFHHSRAYALQKHRPLTLQATIDLPKLGDDPSSSTAGLVYLVGLYHAFDDTFMSLWNKSRFGCTALGLVQLQANLAEALPDYLGVEESQAVDLRTSQQWLRMIVWQLSITNGLLSSSSLDPSMTFQYPVEIANDLVAAIGRVSKHSMDVHGIWLVCPFNAQKGSFT